MRLGIAHHLGWAVAVTATTEHGVADRRRIELVEPGLPAAPVHHVGGPHALHQTGESLDHAELADLVAAVRASALRMTATALDDLAATLPAPIESVSLAAWPPGFPADIATQRRPPYESRADSVMYREVLAATAGTRDWALHLYDAKTVEAEARRLLGARAAAILEGPRAVLGPPWSKDHRVALAATVMTGASASSASAPR